jgi:hypothetical protein
MALNFPPTPAEGDLWVVGSRTYRWSGFAWLVVAVAIDASHIVASTVQVTTSTNSTSTTSGALIVAGGVAIGGDLYLGGTLYSGGAYVLTTASFNNTPSDGTDIDIVDIGGGVLTFNNISTLETVTSRGSTSSRVINLTNITNSTSTQSGALIVAGGIGAGGRVTSESVRIADTVFDSTMVTTNSPVQIEIDTFSLSQYRSAKYFIQIDEGTTSTAKVHAVEMLLIANNTGTSRAVEYGIIAPWGELGAFSSDVTVVGDENIVTLYFTPIDSIDKTVKVLRTSMSS